MTVVESVVLRGTRLVIPAQLRHRVLQLAHEGHQGIVKIKLRLREKVLWPGIDKDITTCTEKCHACQLVGKSAVPEPVNPTTPPDNPWEELLLDILGPFPDGDYVVALVDNHLRYPELLVMRNVTISTITDWLDQVFARHGLPLKVTVDNRPQFTSPEFRENMENRGVTLRHVTSYWPQANGEIKTLNRTLLKAIRTSHTERKDWRQKLSTFIMAYRSTPHVVTGLSPAEMLFNSKIRTKLPSQPVTPTAAPIVRHRDFTEKEKGKQYAVKRRRAKVQTFKTGDRVLLRQKKFNKLSTTFEPTPYTVVSKTGNMITIRDNGGKFKKRNASLLKLSNGNNPNSEWLTDQQDSDSEPDFFDHPDDDLPQPMNPPVNAPEPRRTLSGPNVRVPSYLNDYVSR
ncbi:uncharacterized protein K02A2.6-like [Liolophura sinensis]|uniref:uncharacterized protein K02A2.6-like n=1 Tax=Liolophura sinensis TaxID=3198878 RepID=UPI0031596E50